MATKIKSIPLLGLSTSPGDTIVDDGSLSSAINVFHEDRSIKPLSKQFPKKLFSNGSDMVVYRHRNENYSHLIIYSRTTGYWWIDENDMGTMNRFAKISDTEELYLTEEAVSIVGVGNSLVFACSNNTYYFQWAADEEEDVIDTTPSDPSYKFLGNHLPELKIQFGLSAIAHRNMDEYIEAYADSHGGGYKDITFEQGSEYYDDCDKFTMDADYTDGTETVLTGEDITKATDASLSAINRFVGGWADENGLFTQPFFVRAAFRMFDNSLSMHTPPVLMRPTTTMNPIVSIMRMKDKKLFLDAVGVGCKLTYHVEDDLIDTIKWKWKDFIQGVEIYVSQPFYTYDQDGKVKKFYSPYYSDDETLSLPDDIPPSESRENIICYEGGEGNSWVHQLVNHKNVLYSHDDIRVSINPWQVAGISYKVIVDRTNKKLFGAIDEHAFTTFYGESPSKGLFGSSEQYQPVFYPLAYMDVPEKYTSEKARDNEIKSCSNFYFLKFYGIDELETGGAEIELNKGQLNNIVSSDTMTDEYESHHSLTPKVQTVYNGRLNIAQISKSYFEGFSPALYTSYQISRHNIYDVTPVVIIQKDGNEYVCVGDTAPVGNLNNVYFYYPDPDAAKVIFFAMPIDGSDARLRPMTVEHTLKEHEGLNGAYLFNGFDSETTLFTGGKQMIYDGAEFNELLGNYMLRAANQSAAIDNHSVYTSEVTNPFVFKAANVERVGNGKIIALVPQVIALSEDQSGASPMTAFTTDGVWKLEVNSTGGWACKYAFTRDVVLNEDAGNILQLDQQVMFATDRGLMLLSRNSVECVSTMFDGVEMSPLVSATKSQTGMKYFLTHKVLSHHTDLMQRRDDSEYVLFPTFSDFIGNAVFLYDYRHQRIIIGNPDYPFAYVYNMKDGVWTSIQQRIVGSVNSYPKCYAMIDLADEGADVRALVNFCEETTDNESVNMPTNGFLLTRPIKLGDATALKTIRTINAQGEFARSHVDMILFGCSDNAMQNWFLLSSCKGGRMAFKYGTPFKYFRVAIITRLEAGESLDSLTMEYEVKDNYKLRQ